MWWTYGSLDEFDGVRFRKWRSEADEKQFGPDEEQDSDFQERIGEGRNGPVTMREEPPQLALFPECGEVEFEIV